MLKYVIKKKKNFTLTKLVEINKTARKSKKIPATNAKFAYVVLLNVV